MGEHRFVTLVSTTVGNAETPKDSSTKNKQLNRRAHTAKRTHLLLVQPSRNVHLTLRSIKRRRSLPTCNEKPIF